MSFANKVVKVQLQKFVCSLYGVPKTLQYIFYVQLLFSFCKIFLKIFHSYYNFLVLFKKLLLNNFFIFPMNFSDLCFSIRTQLDWTAHKKIQHYVTGSYRSPPRQTTLCVSKPLFLHFFYSVFRVFSFCNKSSFTNFINFKNLCRRM